MSHEFADRLNRLFDALGPPGEGPHRSSEVVAALKAGGVFMSAPYLSQLRSGNRTKPSLATMAALAKFFRVEVAYFTDDAYYESLDWELTLRAHRHDDGLPHLATRAKGLSPSAQRQLVELADELRRKEKLGEV